MKSKMVPGETKRLSRVLRSYAEKYETASFIEGDPSWFIHQVSGKANQEVTAFIAACLSYGSREQFVPKIQLLFDCAKGNLYEWVKSGVYSKDIPHDSDDCFYRLYTFRQFNTFLCRLRQMLLEYDSIGQYVRKHCDGDAMSAIETICQWSTCLAENDIGIFAISTFNTDNILTKAENFEKAVKTLEAKGYKIC